MRQYSRVKGEKGRAFTYRDIKKVYVIVIYEQSAKVFHEIPDACIHYGRNVFNTGLKMELLCECCLVALDVFRKFPYAKDRSEQTAWLSLLATEDLAEAEGLIAECPWLEEIYGEIAMLRQRPEEVLGMFSEALKILDQNTVKYMIEELQKKVEERDAVIDKKDAVIKTITAERDNKINALAEKDAEIEALKKQLEQLSE